MDVLIVLADHQRGMLWRQHLEPMGARVTQVATGEQAITAIEGTAYAVIVLDLMLQDGGALAVADLVQFRTPETNVIYVTDTAFFSDGSIFNHSANARAFLPTATPPADLAAIIYHYGSISRAHAVPTDQSVD
jgi:CheY-like chemotaxis protein